MSKKYEALGDYLKARATQNEVRLSFAEIEAIIGAKLPPSAYDHRPWWSNNPSNNVMTRVWRDAGFESEHVDMEGRKLVFRNVSRVLASDPTARAFGEEPREYRAAEAIPQGRHPAIGALKGTFTIEPGWDVTKPALDPEELAEWYASLAHKADLYQQSLKGKKQ